MSGMDLLRALIEGTGLPAEAVDRELQALMAARGLRVEDLTMDHVREIMVNYLQDTLVEAKDAF